MTWVTTKKDSLLQQILVLFLPYLSLNIAKSKILEESKRELNMNTYSTFKLQNAESPENEPEHQISQIDQKDDTFDAFSPGKLIQY